MQRLKLVISVVVIGISLVMLVLSLAGIIWGWNAMARLSSSLVNVLADAETRLLEVDQRLDQVDTTLTQLRQEIADVEENVEALGADPEQNGRLMTVISDTVGAKVAPLVNRANEVMTTVRETIAAISNVIETLNAIPFISIPTPDLAGLRQVSDELATLQTTVSELRTTLSERRSELIQGAVALLTTSLDRIDQILESVQTRVAESMQRLDATRTRLTQLKDTIPTALNIVTLLNTLVLLWLAFAQVGLLIHGWRFLTGNDLMARWQ